MRTNLEHSRIYSPRVSGLKLDSITLALSASFTIPDEGPTVWMFNGGTSDRAIQLPSRSLERQLVIANAGSTNDLNILGGGGISLVDIPPLALGVFFGGASRWVWLTDKFVSDEVAITDIVASGAVAATDVIVHVNGAGAVVLTLPTSASWLLASGGRGLPLEIADISGAASTNNITINPAGAETIGGNASLTISADYGSYQLRPLTAGGWTYR